ncbi:uncharacterized protein EURHEDRAFT_375727 [Aspergillus ruber CBS 135680]|uniref:Uncharacterized protein n=1 Tax=Aspergillus ruber (strain CBS 135680) TaxID=1388766 RepID=A0A017SK56_ASPRC|nr:uncharacterized protein EURHEDRAFT_375727 [Aspergillus ruber CBS 135680]EYE97131.1 hypothetical protein EURHEDRAFT_375727 [Aspergillus ruber CBS 135680]
MKDAGPRLLSCAVARGVVPASRWYPDPPVLGVGTGVGFIRPRHALGLLPDVYVERMLLASSSVQGEPTGSGQEDNGDENGNGDDDGDAQMQDATMTDPTSNFTDIGSFIHLPPVQHHPMFEAVE